MSAPFTPSRDDGRSDRRVVLDLVGDGEPGVMFSYDRLTAALEKGLDEPIVRDRIYRAVAAADRTLLKEKRRHLEVVKGVGYRVIRADEHLPVAVQKKERAETYIRRGVDMLRNARVEELSTAQRTLHEGYLLVMDGIYRAVQHSEARQREHDDAIADLRKRMEQIEGEKT